MQIWLHWLSQDSKSVVKPRTGLLVDGLLTCEGEREEDATISFLFSLPADGVISRASVCAFTCVSPVCVCLCVSDDSVFF